MPKSNKAGGGSRARGASTTVSSGDGSYTQFARTHNAQLQREAHKVISGGGELVVRTNVTRPVIINRYSDVRFDSTGMYAFVAGSSKKRTFFDNDDIARMLHKPVAAQAYNASKS